MSTTPDPSLQRQVDLLRQALTLMVEERQALEDGNWSEVERLSAEKLRLYDQLQSSATRWSHTSPTDDDLWRARQDLLLELRRQNEHNGRLIATLRRFHEGAWQVLFGGDLPLYDGIGQVMTASQGHHLGSA